MPSLHRYQVKKIFNRLYWANIHPNKYLLIAGLLFIALHSTFYVLIPNIQAKRVAAFSSEIVKTWRDFTQLNAIDSSKISAGDFPYSLKPSITALDLLAYGKLSLSEDGRQSIRFNFVPISKLIASTYDNNGKVIYKFMGITIKQLHYHKGFIGLHFENVPPPLLKSIIKQSSAIGGKALALDNNDLIYFPL